MTVTLVPVSTDVTAETRGILLSVNGCHWYIFLCNGYYINHTSHTFPSGLHIPFAVCANRNHIYVTIFSPVSLQHAPLWQWSFYEVMTRSKCSMVHKWSKNKLNRSNCFSLACWCQLDLSIGATGYLVPFCSIAVVLFFRKFVKYQQHFPGDRYVTPSNRSVRCSHTALETQWCYSRIWRYRL